MLFPSWSLKWGGRNVLGNKISVYATVFRKSVKCGPWACLSLTGVRQQGNYLHKALLHHPSLSWADLELQCQVLLKPKSLPVSASVCRVILCWTLLQPELENSNFHSCDVCNTNKGIPREFHRSSQVICSTTELSGFCCLSWWPYQQKKPGFYWAELTSCTLIRSKLKPFSS